MTHRKHRYYIKKIQATFVDQNENVIIFMCSVSNYARPYRGYSRPSACSVYKITSNISIKIIKCGNCTENHRRIPRLHFASFMKLVLNFKNVSIKWVVKPHTWRWQTISQRSTHFTLHTVRQRKYLTTCPTSLRSEIHSAKYCAITTEINGGLF